MATQDSNLRTRGSHSRVRVVLLVNSITHYRTYVHSRIVHELPGVELYTLTTHANSFGRWQGIEAPPLIQHVPFGQGEPNNEQTAIRFAWREWRKAGRIIRWLQEHRIQAVFLQGFGDAGRMRILRWCHHHGVASFIVGDNNIRGDHHSFWYRWAKQLVLGRALAWATGVCPCGEYGRLLFERYGGAGKTVSYFPFLPDVQLYQSPPPDLVHQAQQRFGLDPNRKRILFCGRMMPVKRPELAIRAFAAVANQRPQWDLLMLGEGPLRAGLTASIPAALRKRIHFLGFIHSTPLMAGLYALSNVLLLPSDKEPWGMVIQEAASAGLGIVTTDVVGASPELVKPGRNGFAVPPGDLDALTAVLLAMTTPSRISHFQSASREVFDEWLAAYDPVDGFRQALEAAGFPLDRTPRPAPAQAIVSATPPG